MYPNAYGHCFILILSICFKKRWKIKRSYAYGLKFIKPFKAFNTKQGTHKKNSFFKKKQNRSLRYFSTLYEYKEHIKSNKSSFSPLQSNSCALTEYLLLWASASELIIFILWLVFTHLSTRLKLSNGDSA